jgi:hypothetical protein
LPLKTEAEEPTGGLDDTPAGRDYLGTDPIAGDEDELVGCAGRYASGGGGGIGHE